MPGPMSDTRVSLADRMRALADTGHARATELREKADELDRKTEATFAGKDGAAKSMLGAWARARRLWCDCTGEPLI